jgi:hypothetical protein
MKSVNWPNVARTSWSVLQLLLVVLLLLASLAWERREDIRAFLVSTLAVVLTGLSILWDLGRRAMRWALPRVAGVAAAAADRSRRWSADPRPLVAAAAPVAAGVVSIAEAAARALVAVVQWWRSEQAAAVAAAAGFEAPEVAAAPEGMTPAAVKRRRGGRRNLAIAGALAVI